MLSSGGRLTWDVEEPLICALVEVARQDPVGSRAGEEIRHQGASLGHPQLVTRSGTDQPYGGDVIVVVCRELAGGVSLLAAIRGQRGFDLVDDINAIREACRRRDVWSRCGRDTFKGVVGPARVRTAPLGCWLC